MIRQRSVTVDGKRAVAYVLGQKIVIAWDGGMVAKGGTHDDLQKLGDDHKLGELAGLGYEEVK